MVELLIVVTVTGILIGVLFGPLNAIYMSYRKDITTVNRVADTRGSLSAIEHNITLSSKFLHQNTVADPNGVTWDWRGPNADPNETNNRVLITSNYATTIDEALDPTGSRTLVTGASCPTPLENNYVYFVKDKALWRRTIIDKTSPCSGSIGQKQTCPPGAVNAFCQASDAKIISDVKEFKIDYYTNANDPAPATDQYIDPLVSENATTVVITLTAETGTGTQAKSTTGKIRITRINGAT